MPEDTVPESESPVRQPSIEDSLKIAQEAGEAAKASAAAASESHRSAVTSLEAIASIATLATAAKTQITDEQAVIKMKSEHIQGAQDHADKVRSDLDKALTAARQQVTEAEGSKTAAAKVVENLESIESSMVVTKTTVDTDAVEIAKAKTLAVTSAAMSKGLADRAAEVENKLKAYESRLADLEKQCKEQLQEITRLLPGATSAGLASAFDDRRETFEKPRKRWQWIFVGSIIAIAALAGTGLWQAMHTVHIVASADPSGTVSSIPGYDELLRLWIARLPIILALIWLAVHSGHESALAKRMEEDYGFKSATAASFQGFHKQMAEAGKEAEANSSLMKLNDDTLRIIANPPGRIYESHPLTKNPAKEVTETVKGVAEVAKAVREEI